MNIMLVLAKNSGYEFIVSNGKNSGYEYNVLIVYLLKVPGRLVLSRFGIKSNC